MCGKLISIYSLNSIISISSQKSGLHDGPLHIVWLAKVQITLEVKVKHSSEHMDENGNDVDMWKRIL